MTTLGAEQHQQLLAKYSVPDMGDYTAPGGRVSLILERLEMGGELSREDKQFISDKGLFDLVEFVAKLEQTGFRDFRALNSKAEEQSRSNRRRDLFRKYEMDWVESQDLGRVMRILESAEKGGRISDEDVLWLSTHNYFSSELRRAFHRREAAVHKQAFLDEQDPWHAVNASSHYRQAGMSQEALSLLGKANVEGQRNKHLRAALLTTQGGALRDIGGGIEALGLAEQAHATEPESFHPCTLIGALKFEAGDYASGDIWFQKAVERGATVGALDNELRGILRRADKNTKERLKQHLLRSDPVRFAWVRDGGGRASKSGAPAGRRR